MKLTITKISDSGKSGFAVVSKKVGFATINVAAGYVRVDEGTKVGDELELPADAKLTAVERTSDGGTCTWLQMS